MSTERDCSSAFRPSSHPTCLLVFVSYSQRALELPLMAPSSPSSSVTSASSYATTSDSDSDGPSRIFHGRATSPELLRFPRRKDSREQIVWRRRTLGGKEDVEQEREVAKNPQEEEANEDDELVFGGSSESESGEDSDGQSEHDEDESEEPEGGEWTNEEGKERVVEGSFGQSYKTCLYSGSSHES